MEEWKECKLGDFFELHRGYDLTKSEIKEGPYPVVCSTSIMGYHNEYKVKAPGVVIGRSGTLGEVQFIDTDYWPHNTSLYVSDFKGNFPKFIKYFLQLFGTGNVGGGSAVPTLNRNHLQALTVRVPPLPTQQKIAAILSSLDDKIELNNKINTNLEQQAQALFKNWFVDFEPFGGKMPEWWKVGTIGDLCSTISKTYKSNDSHVVLINTSDVENGIILNHESVPNSNLKGQFKKTFQKGDILYSEIRPANKHYAFVDIDTTSNYIASTKLMVIRPNEDINPHYLYHILTNPDLIQEMQHLAETRSELSHKSHLKVNYQHIKFHFCQKKNKIN